jgi:hypothetical protein
LNAAGDVHINAAVTTTRGSLEVCCGRDINVNALITTTGVAATPNTGGNVLLAAGRDVNIVRAAATIPLPDKNLTGITTTNGNIEICAGRDINLDNTFNGAALLTLSNSVADSVVPTGPVTPRGMTLIAGTNGTGPGALAGTLKIGVGTIITVTGPAGISPINIFYNPTLYTTPTDYSGFFATGNGGPYVQYMLVFPEVTTKTADGTTVAAFTGALKGLPPGVTLALPGTANFDTAAVGANKTVTFTGATLTQGPLTVGGLGINYDFANPCCGPAGARTTGTIIAALPPVPPVPPVVVPLPVDAEDYAAEEMMGPEGFMPATFAISPRLMPRVELAGLPPQLRSIAPIPVPVVQPPPPVAEEPPPVYVPPLRPRKQDRN